METIKEETAEVLPSKIKEMFSYKGKLQTLVPKEWIERYKDIYTRLRKKLASGELPSHPNYLDDNELAKNIYEKKYYLKCLSGKPIEKRPEELFIRVASFVAAVEEKDGEVWAEKFYLEMYNGYWVPGGRVLAGAGDLYRFKTLANCFVSKIEDDSIESIFKTAYEAARTYSYGGGIGIDLSVLRPIDTVVHNAADKSTGAVSFMQLYSTTTGLIGQSGRRGALMLTLDMKHPDSERFIKIKRTPNWTTKQIVEQLKWQGDFKSEQLELIEKQVMENTQVRFANISLKISDEFMHAVMEENKYRGKILVYKKLDKGTLMDMPEDYKQVHYSIEMPAKNINNYELLGKFDSIEEANKYLSETFRTTIKEDFDDPYKRDIYGDYFIGLENQSYDLAIRRAGDFLLFFSSNEVGVIKRLVKARYLWNLFIESNYKTAEPGLMFWSTLTKYSPSNYLGKPIITTNPCGEVPLEDGGSCNLGSINLSRFVDNPFTEKAKIKWKKLDSSVELLHRFLDNVIDWNIYLNPLEKQRMEAAKKTRRVGIGMMGIGDLLNEMGLAYDSEEALEVMEKIAKNMVNKAYESSAKLAKEKGTIDIWNYEKYKEGPFFQENLEESTKKLIAKNGLRNIALMSIAPTGTISNIVKSFEIKGKNYIGVSSGLEPIFALYYNRRSESFGNKVFRMFHSTVQAYLDLKGLKEKAEKARDEELKGLIPEHFFRTAHEINPKRRVEIQSKLQRYIDHSISSTVNLPEDISPETISEIYLYAWEKGLKGITIYRDGSRYPILSVEGEKSEFSKFKDKHFKIMIDGKEVVVKGDDVIVLPDGKLTTTYHAIKDGLFKGVEL